MNGRATKLLRKATERVADARGVPKRAEGADKFFLPSGGPPHRNMRKGFGRSTRRGLYGLSHRSRRRAYAALRIDIASGPLQIPSAAEFAARNPGRVRNPQNPGKSSIATISGSWDNYKLGLKG